MIDLRNNDDLKRKTPNPVEPEGGEGPSGGTAIGEKPGHLPSGNLVATVLYQHSQQQQGNHRIPFL